MRTPGPKKPHQSLLQVKRGAEVEAEAEAEAGPAKKKPGAPKTRMPLVRRASPAVDSSQRSAD